MGLGSDITIGKLGASYLSSDKSFDRRHKALFLGRYQRIRIAHFKIPAGAPDAVDIILGFLRDVEVDDMADFANVEASGRNIGRDHDLAFAALKIVQRMVALRLREIRVHGDNGQIFRCQKPREAIRAALGAAKDEHGFHVGVAKDREKQIVFLGRHDRVKHLSHGIRGSAARRDRDRNRLFERQMRQPPDFRRQRRRKKHGLALARHVIQDAVEGGRKSHVEHAVRLIQNEGVHAREADRAALQVVQKPARRRDHK